MSLMVVVRGLWTNFSLHLKTANFSSLKWVANSASRKILHEITRIRTASKLSVLAYNLLQLYPYKRTTVKKNKAIYSLK